MEYNVFEKEIGQVKNGQFFRVQYVTEPKTARGISATVKKITTKTVRTGVSYHNINGAPSASESDRKPWAHYVMDNKVLKHNNNDDYYLCFSPVKGKGSNTKVVWLVNGNEVNEDYAKSLLNPSYFNHNELLYQNVNVKNIVSISSKKKGNK